MGKRHRQQRKWAKIILFKRGYSETELGELKRTMSKAEARMRLAQWLHFQVYLAEGEILDALIARSTKELQAIEDAVFLEMLSNARAAHIYSISG